MIILQGAIHIFTEQPNSVAKSIYNGLRRQMTHLLEYETIKTSTIIQYPHAVSYFCELNLSYDYIAMTYSKKKGVPVLVSIVGKKVNQGLEVEEALRLYWGNRGKCISKIEAFSTGNTISALWGDRIFEKCGIGRDEGGDGGKTLEIRGKRRLSARDGGANYQQS